MVHKETVKRKGVEPVKRLSAAAALKALKAFSDKERAKVSLWFFKTDPGEYGEGDRFLGVAAAPVRKLTKELREMPLDETIKLLHSPWHEARSLALLIMALAYAKGDEEKRQAIYDAYLANTDHINNWDLVDCSAEHVVGAHLEARSRAPLKKLARSQSLWERRIAIIATFRYIKKGEFRETLKIAEILVNDKHDLIHKAVGWMLREVGKRGGQAEEEEFLRMHCGTMPRTMLRYAIERFPEELRRKYMEGRVGN